MTSTEEAAAPLAELRGAGVHVALDDFGTGFSSLRYLGELPADILKVDRSFMGDEHEPTEIMLETVIQLAVRLGLMVVVEGIESEHDLARVQRLGHVAAQGYYFARPLPFERALDYVRADAAQRV